MHMDMQMIYCYVYLIIMYFQYNKGRTCSVVRWIKLSVRQYLLPLKLMGYHGLNGSNWSDRPPKSPVTRMTKA